MKHLILFGLAILLGTAAGAEAQPLVPAPGPAAGGGPAVVHVTDHLLRQPAAQAALASYRPQPRRTVHAVQATLPLGTEQTFKVRNMASSSVSFDDIVFTLKAQEARFRIWVETAELNKNHVREADIEAMRRALGERTPDGSYDADAGIVINNEAIFGPPPNTDGDGVLDVLLVDVRDGRDEGEGFVAGFVDPLDLSATGNNRDVLYIDTQPGMFSDDDVHLGTDRAQATAAHEYQHLIRMRYDRNEATFVDEGLSEWAELLNGYPGRSITYLAAPARYNVPLLRWSSNNTTVLDDYQRAGLFTTYLADRLGPEATGAITRDPAVGLDGYENALDGIGMPLEQALFDFHTTNLINDSETGFAYEALQRLDVMATEEEIADGRSGTTDTPRTTFAVESGAVSYRSWVFVDDFTFTLDVPVTANGDPVSRATRRNRLRARAILEHDGAVTVQDVALGPTEQTITGSFDRVTLVVGQVLPEAPETEVFVEAAWTNDSAFQITSVVYDDGQAETFALVSGVTAGYATRFEVPAGSRLGPVLLPIYFYNQFGDPPNVPPDDAPRDFELVVWGVKANGEPGAELYRTLVTDTRASQDVFQNETNTRFLEVDLTEAMAEVDLPEALYIGAVNDSGDSNWLVYTASRYNAENVSYVRQLNGAWGRVWDVQFQNGSDLDGHMIPIRASFLTPRTGTPNEPVAELPKSVTLHPNYPNPFNPQTTIRYELSEAGPVRLTIYDVVGREVAVLADGLQPAGTHALAVEAGDWASGVYLYVLEAGGQRLTRQMLLVK